jgi:hypothetical protein
MEGTFPVEFEDLDPPPGQEPEKQSEKHEVDNGLEEVPPEPEKEDVHHSDEHSSAAEESSDFSEGMRSR